ncbi:MAG TPA: GGDEF domain-containing protein [Acidobacteriota bacterium]|nr:GGDEF domain-containing protein [Acidobacteriota bacterium]
MEERDLPVRYRESPEVSAEYLRMVLPLIAQHGVPCNPVNYAVWYEYVAESCSELKGEIDSLLEEGQSLTNELCETLYRKYISEPDSEVLRHLQNEMKRLMGDVYGSVEAVGQQADRFDRSLRDYGDRLESAPDPEGLRKIVGGILSRVDVMQEANGVLRRHLQDSARQVRELQRELEKTRHEALTDPLTGLANRKAFDRALLEALQSAQTDDSLCLVLLDIDRFKRFNDTYGHLLGDKVLRLVGAVLRQSTKGKDLAARFGGEEFAIILPETPLKGAMALADQIRRAVESGRVRRVDNGDTVGRVTISAGVAGWRKGEGVSSLIARADAALYYCKERGRNRICSQEEMEGQADAAAIACP